MEDTERPSRILKINGHKHLPRDYGITAKKQEHYCPICRKVLVRHPASPCIQCCRHITELE